MPLPSAEVDSGMDVGWPNYDPWIWSSGKQEPVASVCIANNQNFHAQKNTKRNKLANLTF